ncbi:MAG TPA: glycoside hydrolase family 9 protein [Terracidiphilus sp.]|jgi:endoglucanase|nr:glycoside hydrolase family 9 protein [Terracidiphilus sp.]
MPYFLFRAPVVVVFRTSRALLTSALFVGLLFSPALLAHSAAAGAAVSASTAIKVDQVGYPLIGPKVALVSAPADSFQVRQSSDGHVVFRGTLTPSAVDANSGDTVEAADFSTLHKAGRYYLEVPGVGRSWDFAVEKSVFDRAYTLAMRGFYGQRCGVAVDMGPEFPEYKHAACHQKGEFHPSSGASGPRNNIGGWHDAGDYGRYMVNSGVTTGTLLWAWEIYGEKLKPISLKIPESGNGTPDILNETRWNLDWMLKMQDDDGGVWHKQTSEHFSGFVAPEDDDLPSEVIGTGKAPYKSTCATADLAAVGAIAARVYKPFDAAFAARALDAARKAWAWAEKNPDVTFRNPHGVSTGEYGDSSCADERVWAAAELWRTTGEKPYNDFFVAQYANYLPSLDSPPAEGWNALGAMGLWSYALGDRNGSDSEAIKAIRARTVAAAHAVVERTNGNPYHTSMQARDYVWGSNGVAAGYGMYLLIADRFVPDKNFRDAARDNLHYLLGRNTFSLSWVTQLGEHSVEHPHHRPSGSGKQPGPWPGLLSGGPNAGRQDAVLAALPKNLPPAKVYADQLASYASNEIAINWQASLVFLLAGQLQ